MKLAYQISLSSLALVFLFGCASATPKTEEPVAANPVIFQGHGGEPGWTLDIIRDQAIVVTTYADDEKKTELPWVQPQQTGQTVVYEQQNRENPFRLIIAPGPCSDGMSDQTYPNQVTLNLNGQILQGCGESNP